MEKHLKELISREEIIRREERFFKKLEPILLEQIKIYANSNRDKFSYIEEIKARRFIEFVIFSELDIMYVSPKDYYESLDIAI
tara:strand:- start:501 stop:749 length:249 start_codon:yes stop_codon:yes gene_type:complete